MIDGVGEAAKNLVELAVEKEETAKERNEEVMKRYDEQKMVMGRIVGKLLKAVAICFSRWHFHPYKQS